MGMAGIPGYSPGLLIGTLWILEKIGVPGHASPKRMEKEMEELDQETESGLLPYEQEKLGELLVKLLEEGLDLVIWEKDDSEIAAWEDKVRRVISEHNKTPPRK